MEKIKTKKPTVIRNAVKVKVLLFLEMRSRPAIAREIARATGCGARSLYVLLQRWAEWDLVICYDEKPYSYRLGSEGSRYLSKIDRWFFKGYHSKKLKKRVPGYGGNAENLKREIATASKAVLWWRYHPDYPKGIIIRSESDRLRGMVCYIKAPFNRADNFVKVENSRGRSIQWAKVNMITKKFGNGVEACNFLPQWGFARELAIENPMIKAVVAAHVGVYWPKTEENREVN